MLAVVIGGAERHFHFCVHSSLRCTFSSSVPYTDLVLLLRFLPASQGWPCWLFHLLVAGDGPCHCGCDLWSLISCGQMRSQVNSSL